MQSTKSVPQPDALKDVVSQLYLVTSAPIDLNTVGNRLLQATAALPVAAVLLDAREATDITELQGLITEIQSHNIATLVSGDLETVRTTNADGCHLHWHAAITDEYKTARTALGEELMIGADAGKSRHDAMLLAESGADYVAFGVPAKLKDQQTARQRQVELIAWWVNLFEVPVVAFDIATPEQAGDAKRADADFVAATLPPDSADQAQFDAWISAFGVLFSESHPNA